MDLPLTRELARLASVLELLRTQREVLSELSDIKEFRGLESDFSDALKEAQVKSLVPRDPVSVVRADWQRLVRWSNQVQDALREVDELGQELSKGVTGEAPEGSRKRKRGQGEWKPNISQLRELEQALEVAPARLAEIVDQARGEVQEEDWIGQRPYSELTEVAEALGWGDPLELAEPVGPWAEGVPPRARPLVVTRMATETGSRILQRRVEALRAKLSQVKSLKEKHADHARALEEVGRLTDAGQVETARRLIGTLQGAFGDLDYQAREQKLAQLEKRLKSQGETVTETRSGLQVLVREAGGFFAFPPIGLLRRGGVALAAAEKVVRETAQLGREGGASEVDQMVSAWVHGLKSEVDSFRSLSMARVRRWIWVGALFWVVALVASGVTFQQIQARQERERQRIAAEAKAKMEVAEMAIGKKLGLSRPFGPGVRGELGLIAVRWIPAGRFTMGSRSSEPDRDSDEIQHEVELSRGFFMAETECTQGQWEAVMGSNPSRFKGKDRPVEGVNWGEAVEFCRKLTATQRQEGVLAEGWEWRLPTESEWEYAARAGTTGARHGELDAIGWHGGNAGSEAHEVKGKQANAWGLHDMIGNVWEWCGDWYGGYPTGSVTDPTGPSSGSLRVIRGGGWNVGARFERSARRQLERPGPPELHLGFRPALCSIR